MPSWSRESTGCLLSIVVVVVVVVLSPRPSTTAAGTLVVIFFSYLIRPIRINQTEPPLVAGQASIVMQISGSALVRNQLKDVHSCTLFF